MNGNAGNSQPVDLARGVHAPKAFTLQDEVESRKIWFYECQLRWLNFEMFRGVTEVVPEFDPDPDPFPDRRIDLISKPASAEAPLGSRATTVGKVYREDGQPVWTPDEVTRRDALRDLIGKNQNWLGYQSGQKLAEKLAGLKEKYEKSRFSSQSDLDSELNIFGRRHPRRDMGSSDNRILGSMGRAISRATLAELKPWLIPELYNAKNKDSGRIENWIGNLEAFIGNFEADLGIAIGGTAGQPIPFDPLEVKVYRAWIRLMIEASSTRNLAASLKARMLTQVKNPADDSFTYFYEINIKTNGYPMGPVDKFPFSESVKYWIGVVRSALGEVYVNKPNADMGLCQIMRTIYLLGALPSALGSELPWRKRKAPDAEFKAFFDKKREEAALKDDATLDRFENARTKLEVILGESAANPHSASPAFSPLAQEVMRQAIHAFKFWMDEPLRVSTRDKLLKARSDTGIVTNKHEMKAEMEYWSENHYIMFASSEFLAGQLWKADEFQPGKEFLDPNSKLGILSGEARMARGKARILKWLNNRLMFGWTEFNSSGYYREHFWSLLNLTDFSLDSEVRDKAALALDLLLFDVARFQHKGTMGAAGGRSQFGSKGSGWSNAAGDLVEIFFGTRGIFLDADGQIGSCVSTTTYRAPEVLLEIGTNPPATPFTDRSRVSVTFEEAPKYGIGYSKESDQKDSMMEGYAPKRARHYPFLDAVNQEIARTHTGYGATEDDTVFWWELSAFYNKQIVRNTFSVVNAFGLTECQAFHGALPLLIKLVATYEKVKHRALVGGIVGTFVGGAIGAAAGAGSAAGIAVGAAEGLAEALGEAIFSDDDLLRNLEEAASDDLSVLLEGSTRTRANILSFRSRDIMLSSIQNFRAGQLNFQSSVCQASLNPSVNVLITAGLEDFDISELVAGIAGSALGAALGAALNIATGGIGAYLTVTLGALGAFGANAANDLLLKHQDLGVVDDVDGPGWWTGSWALPMVVQHDSAAILACDFHAIQNLLAQSGSHAWFPKAGFDLVDEMRTSAYDDADFPLLDIGGIGPKGFWLFGKMIDPPSGSKPAGESREAYIGVFSNQRPEWLTQDSDFYERRIKSIARKTIKEKLDAIVELLSELEDDDLLGNIGKDTIKSAVDRAVNDTLKPNMNRDDWLNAAKEELGKVTDILVQARVDKANELAELEIDLKTQQRIWPDPLPQDYFKERDWYVEGKNIWIMQVGSREEFGDFQNFKDRVSSARIHLDDSGDMECSYDIPRAGGGSERLTLAYGDGGRFSLDGGSLQTDFYPRFENPFVRGGRVEWGQREYVIEYKGKSLLHDFSDFSKPLRPEKLRFDSKDRNTIKGLVIFLKTEDEEMDDFTVAKADVAIGCDRVTRDQVIAAGPTEENADHDAEWIFFDFPSLRNEDMTVSVSHPASSKGDDTPHWKMSFSLRALMGDRTVRQCSLSYSSFDFEDEKRTSTPFPFSVSMSEWRPWKKVQDSKRPSFWMIASRPDFTKVYYDYHDLVVVDPSDRLWHRRLMSCETAETGWFPVPASGGTAPDLSALFIASAVTVQPKSLFLFVQSQGTLFVSWPSQSGDWSNGWKTLSVSIYPDGFLGLPDRTARPIPIALALLSPVVTVPSSLSPDGAELFVLAADGNIYSHPDWRPGDTNLWRKIDVSGFSPLHGAEFVVVGDFLFVVGNDRALWATTLDHSVLHRVASWEKVSVPGIGINRFTATCENGVCQIMIATTSRGIFATSYGDGSPPAWVELNLPRVPVSLAAPLTSTVLSAGQARFFTTGTDGRIYTIGWESTAGWHAGLQWSAVEPDSQSFAPRIGGRMAVISRVNGQVELFAQDADDELFKAWWS